LCLPGNRESLAPERRIGRKHPTVVEERMATTVSTRGNDKGKEQDRLGRGKMRFQISKEPVALGEDTAAGCLLKPLIVHD